jgi:hypothetical protein
MKGVVLVPVLIELFYCKWLGSQQLIQVEVIRFTVDDGLAVVATLFVYQLLHHTLQIHCIVVKASDPKTELEVE